MMQTLFPSGWWPFLAGGLCIGLAVALAFVFSGRVTGMSTVFSSTWSWFSRAPFFQQAALRDSRAWRVVFAVGLVLGAALWWWGLGPGASGQAGATKVPAWQLLLGGLLVGYGARLSGGCTSGHGVCGLASLSGVSLGAVLTFMATGIATALAVAAFIGAGA